MSTQGDRGSLQQWQPCLPSHPLTTTSFLQKFGHQHQGARSGQSPSSELLVCPCPPSQLAQWQEYNSSCTFQENPDHCKLPAGIFSRALQCLLTASPLPCHSSAEQEAVQGPSPAVGRAPSQQLSFLAVTLPCSAIYPAKPKPGTSDTAEASLER